MSYYVNYEGKKIDFRIPNGWDLISSETNLLSRELLIRWRNEILNRLNRAGIPDNRITGICSLGTHPIPTLEQLRTEVGDEVFSRLKNRIFPHDPHSSGNVIVGKTHRGAPVEINPYVAFSDLIIGVGECMPHPCAGFGGGHRMIMPGVCSYRSVASHHFTWMRRRNSRVTPSHQPLKDIPT